MFLLTETEFLPRVWRQREAEHRHGGDQQARHDQVGEVVQGAPPVTANQSSVFQLWTNESSPDLDDEGDVQVGLGAALVNYLVPRRWHSWSSNQKCLDSYFVMLIN